MVSLFIHVDIIHYILLVYLNSNSFVGSHSVTLTRKAVRCSLQPCPVYLQPGAGDSDLSDGWGRRRV